MGTDVLQSNVEKAMMPFSGIIDVIVKFAPIFIVLSLIVIISLFRIFQKAGKPGWAAFVPIYNLIVFAKICDMNMMTLLWIFVPLLGQIILWVLLVMNLSRVFGKSKDFGTAMIFVPFICFPMLAFQDAKYKNQDAPMKKVVSQGMAVRGMNQVDGMQLKSQDGFQEVTMDTGMSRPIAPVHVADQSTDVTTSNPQRDLLNAMPQMNVNVTQMAAQQNSIGGQSYTQPVVSMGQPNVTPQDNFTSTPVAEQSVQPVTPIVPLNESPSDTAMVEEEPPAMNPQLAILQGNIVDTPTYTEPPMPVYETPVQPEVNPVPLAQSDVERMQEQPSMMGIFDNPLEMHATMNSTPNVEPTPNIVQTPQPVVNQPIEQQSTVQLDLNGRVMQPSERELANKQAEITPGFKRCPHCGAKVAEHLETCFLCGNRF